MSSSSEGSPSSSALVPVGSPSVRCSVCNMQAFGMNYGVISCNACKMFFRRVVLLSPGYKCKAKGECFVNVESARIRPRCRHCRFNRCLEVGMRYLPAEEEARAALAQQEGAMTGTTSAKSLCSIIQKLLNLDACRMANFEMMRGDEDPTIEDLIKRGNRGLSSSSSPLPVNFQQLAITGPQDSAPQKDQVLSQWCFFGIWASIEFLNNLDFMQLLSPDDKQILLKSFAMSSYLLTAAFKSSSLKSGRLINPDGSDMYPDTIRELRGFSNLYVDRIQKLLVSKLNDLKITSEEYILATVILFCNPATSGLSIPAQQVVADEQRKYSNAFFEYCKLTRGSGCAVRFQEIVSLGDVIRQCVEDTKALSTMLQMYHPELFNCKKLLRESLNE